MAVVVSFDNRLPSRRWHDHMTPRDNEGTLVNQVAVSEAERVLGFGIREELITGQEEG